MGKMLIIAEKPSVASDIAKALGKFSKKAYGWENDKVIVSNAVGHLVGIGVVEPENARFDISRLPVIPEKFDLKVLPKTKAQLKVLETLIKSSEVDTIVNACDAGREGELIFRLIYEHSKSKKVIKRMWFSSMTADAIRDAFSGMRVGADFDNLARAARLRAEADWLLGINGSRVVSNKNTLLTGSWVNYTLGRVQTPTLAILVDRENEILNFKPKSYFEVSAEFKALAGVYKSKWVIPAEYKDEEHNKLFDRSVAEAVVVRCRGKVATKVEETVKPVKKGVPKLYDLTSLQREANSRYGFSAKDTLAIAQALYEKHKVLTYPRTDSSCLPEDYVGKAKEVVKQLGGIKDYAGFSRTILDGGWVKPIKAVFDNSKISDHFAIIPTGQISSSLSVQEQKIYDMVARRFLCVFYPAAEYSNTVRITHVGSDRFKSEGKVLVSEGWLAVYGKAVEDDGTPALVSVGPKELPPVHGIKLDSLETTAPPRYTDATLLAAMEGAGKLVEDSELAEAMKGRGLGTPATRAQVIETLLSDSVGYVVRDKKNLKPMPKGMKLIEVLRKVGVGCLTSPEMTGEWEHKLSQVEKGKFSSIAFRNEINLLTSEVVAKILAETSLFGKGAIMAGEKLGVDCPVCGGDLTASPKVVSCDGCDFKVWKTVAGKTLSDAQVKTLVSKGKTAVISGFESKAGKKFDAALKLEDGKVVFDFGDSTPAVSKKLSCACPSCMSTDLMDKGKTVSCSCGFTLWKTIAGKTLNEEQVLELLTQRATGVISGFKSKAGKDFSAALKLTDEDKVEFVFEERGPVETKAMKCKCPKCKSGMVDKGKTFSCTSCDFKVWKTMASRELTAAEVEVIISEGRSATKLSGFQSKAGKAFDAFVVIEDGEVKFEFN